MTKMRQRLYACLIWTFLIGFGFNGQAVQAKSEHLEIFQIPLVNGQGSVIGKAHLSQTSEGVKIRIEASGLKPGQHGIHFHEKGSCEGSDFSSAGAHFNPFGKQHGFANPQGYHAGDLPNLLVNEKGQANMEFISKAVTLTRGQPNFLLKAEGTSLIIHEQADDLNTDPAGNSGKRIACGVVK